MSNFKNALAFFKTQVDANSQPKKELITTQKTTKNQPTNSNFLKAKTLFENRVNNIPEPKPQLEKQPPINKIKPPSNQNFISASQFFQNIGKRKEEFRPQKRDFHIKGSENIRKAFEFFQSRVVISSNVEKAPEHIKRESKRIEKILLQNELVQNNEIFIEIDYEATDNKNLNITSNNCQNNTINTVTKSDPPPPSKVLKNLPTKTQICLITNTQQEQPKIATVESLKPIIPNVEDAQKVAQFNNYVLEKFKEEKVIPTSNSSQNQTEKKFDMSHFSSNRKKRSRRV